VLEEPRSEWSSSARVSGDRNLEMERETEFREEEEIRDGI